MGDTGCTTSGYLGWYMPLPDSGEQVVYDPVLSPDGEFTVKPRPSPSSILSCTVTPASGWSMDTARHRRRLADAVLAINGHCRRTAFSSTVRVFRPS